MCGVHKKVNLQYADPILGLDEDEGQEVFIGVPTVVSRRCTPKLTCSSSKQCSERDSERRDSELSFCCYQPVLDDDN